MVEAAVLDETEIRKSGVEKAAEITQLATVNDPSYGVGNQFKDVAEKAATNGTAAGAGVAAGLYSKARDAEWAQNLRSNARVSGAVGRINAAGESVDNFFSRNWNRLKDVVVNAFHTVKAPVVNAFRHVKNGASNAVRNVKNWVKKTFKIGSNAEVEASTLSSGTESGISTATTRELSTVAPEAAESLVPAATTAVEEGSTSIFGKAFGALGKVAGIIAIPVTLLVGAFQTKHRIDEKDGHGAAKAAGGTVGGILGGVGAGALEGLLLGAVLGIELPIIGSIVFGIAGAIIGAWMGSKGTDAAVGDAWDKKLKSGSGKKVVVVHDDTGEVENLRSDHVARLMKEREIAASRQNSVA